MKYFIRACASSLSLKNAARQNVTVYDFRNVNQSIDLGVVPGVPLRILEGSFDPSGSFSDRLTAKLAIRNESQLRLLASSEIIDTVDLLVLRGAECFVDNVADFLASLSMVPSKALAQRLKDFKTTYIKPAIAETEAAGYGVKSSIVVSKKVTQPVIEIAYSNEEVDSIRRWGGEPDLKRLSGFQLESAVFTHGNFTVELAPAAIAACYKLFMERLAFSAFANAEDVCLGHYAWVRIAGRKPAHLGPYAGILAGEYVTKGQSTGYARNTEIVDIDCRGACIGDGNILLERDFPFTLEEMVIIPDAADIKDFSDFKISSICLRIAPAVIDKGVAGNSIIGGLY